MSDEPADAEPTEPDSPSPQRGRMVSIAVVAIAAATALGLIGTVVLRATDDPEPVADSTPPRFVDEGASSGLVHSYTGDFDFFVGGGVAVVDCDDDGRPEIYAAGGEGEAALFRNTSDIGGALRFRREPSAVTDLDSVTGAYPIDIDSDDRADLVVLRHGGNVVLRGLGDCRFEAVTDELGIDGGDRWTTAFSATWEGANELPTLAFGNYLKPDADLTTNESQCDDHDFLRPVDSSADGYATPTHLAPGYCTLSMLFSDWGRSGRPDLRATNDRHYYTDGSDQLWRVVPGEDPTEYTIDDGWQPLRVWGMGIASEDVTGDGYPEVFVTSQGDNKLQTLDDEIDAPTYRDIALRRGVTAQRPVVGGDVLPSTAWHPEFDDVNNDGLVDLFVTKGNVEAQPDFASRDPNNLLLGRADGTFVDATEAAGLVDFGRSRGAAVVDLNLDGMLDVVVVNRAADIGLWRNVGAGEVDRPEPMGHWIAVRVKQPSPNVDAVGAWLEVRTDERTIAREVAVGGGHGSGQLGWIHVGLGAADEAEVRVQWPDGTTSAWATVAADHQWTVERDAGRPVRWQHEG